MYKNHARPLARVVQGIPDSWERVVATATFDRNVDDAVWSPCNRFIAVAGYQFVEVLDAVTLGRLSIFKTSHTIPQQLSFSPDGRCLTLRAWQGLINLDLQTGSQLGDIYRTPWHSPSVPFTFKHSEDGKLIAVAYKPHARDRSDVGYSSFISTCDHYSGRHMGSHCFPEEEIIDPIWTHGEYLRFATIDPKSIRIWQCPFTLEPPPVEVTSLPVPDGITDAHRFLFLPSLSRLAFVLRDTIQVWDLQVSKLLLKSELTCTPDPDRRFLPQSSFSSDGRFFAYKTNGDGVHLWKESPTGYLPYQQLPFFARAANIAPRFSPNVESIIVSLGSKLHRLHTRDQVPSLPSVSTKYSRRSDFTLAFSPDENFAAFARRKENTVTVIDLKSGELKWSADMGVEIGCVGMAEGTVIVVGEGSIVTWNLPGGDRTFNASVNDIVRATVFDRSSPPDNLGRPDCMSISPDLSRVVVTRVRRFRHCSLEVDDVSTGLCLARVNTMARLRPHFTRDGHQVWTGDPNFYSHPDSSSSSSAPSSSSDDDNEECEIVEDSESGTIELKLQSAHGGQSGVSRESSSGYAVTDDGWVLSPGQKRLFWLPHRWRSHRLCRAWGGRFLGLLGGELPEVVILEFLE